MTGSKHTAISCATAGSEDANSDAACYVLPSGDAAHWQWVQAQLSQPLPNVQALLRCVRHCEHRVRTGQALAQDAELQSAATTTSSAATAVDKSPLPFAHSSLPSLHYFLHYHLTAEQKADFFAHTLPTLQKVALAMPRLFPDGKLQSLRAGGAEGSEASFTREQSFCIAAHMVSPSASASGTGVTVTSLLTNGAPALV